MDATLVADIEDPLSNLSNELRNIFLYRSWASLKLLIVTLTIKA